MPVQPHVGTHSFFLQAEDGIRDGRVTGVETCALPICSSSACVTKTRICTCCMRSTNSISFVTTATKHSCTTRLRELRDLSSLPSHREWPTCLPMTTESSIAYSFSIRTTLERFCRSIRFELGNRLHCKSGALESADAKREVVCELLRPQELSLPLVVLLNTRICIANLGR